MGVILEGGHTDLRTPMNVAITAIPRTIAAAPRPQVRKNRPSPTGITQTIAAGGPPRYDPLIQPGSLPPVNPTITLANH
jgi:hypothetical protein